MAIARRRRFHSARHFKVFRWFFLLNFCLSHHQKPSTAAGTDITGQASRSVKLLREQKDFRRASSLLLRNEQKTGSRLGKDYFILWQYFFCSFFSYLFLIRQDSLKQRQRTISGSSVISTKTRHVSATSDQSVKLKIQSSASGPSYDDQTSYRTPGLAHTACHTHTHA